jgi:hypothetical protein
MSQIQLNSDNIDLSSIEKTEEFIDDLDENLSNNTEQLDQNTEPSLPLQPQDFKKIIALKQQISNYKESDLGYKLTNYNLSPEYLNTLSEIELEELLGKIRYTIGIKNTSNFWYQSFIYGSKVVEHVGISMGLKLENFSLLLAQDQACKELITEITLKHNKITYIEPEYRLGLLVVGLGHKLHVSNTITEQLTSQINKDNENVQFDEATINKYKDL